MSRGMVVDFAVHQPDREDGGIPNPHFHVLCPIRPIEQNGKWGLKQRRVYELDEDGNRIRDQNGEYVFNAVPTTDWGSPETLEYWRQTWAELCNGKFAEKGLDVRIDHRSHRTWKGAERLEKLKKFEDVDVIASLEAIMKQNTAFYQSDFDIDKRILLEAAARPVAEDKRLLWFSRPSGTCCVRERDVFLKDTRQHNTWRFYGEQTRDKILAYAVELTGTERGKLKGNLYELDYPQHFRDVAEKSILADNYTLIYEHGERSQPAGQYFDGNPDPQLGKFERFEAQPNDLEALKALLREQQHSRKQHRPGDIKEHIAALHDCRIETEAHRVVEEMKKFDKPNSPDKSHFSAELSPYFLRLATDKDMDRLFSMLPYKSLSFSAMEGKHGVYALISKDENRDRSIKKPSPSLRAQLEADKAKTTPKKAAAKSKNHEMEV